MVRLPAWSAAYALFRFGDGLAAAVVPLVVVFHYDLPLWTLAATVAAMNIAAVPASALWGRLMERGRGRRRLAVGSFLTAAASMVWLASLPSFGQYVAAAVLFTISGTATGPAAAVLVMEGHARRDWTTRSARLAALTGWPLVAGVGLAAGLGLVGQLDYGAAFAAAAVICTGAAMVAAATIPAWQAPPSAQEPQLSFVEASQPRIERTVFRPGRLRFRPSLGALQAGLARPYRLWTVGFATVFAAALMVFAVLPGVLADHLGLSAGWILLVKMPGHIAAPLAFGWAGRFGAQVGEGRAAMRGAWIRIAAVGLLVAAVLAAAPWSLAAVMLAQAVMGVTFALLQVNGGCLMAQIHPDGRGAGVGAFHAAVGTGVVVGSVIAWLLLAITGFQVLYVLALLMCLAGAWMLRRAWWRTFPEHRGET